MAGKNVDVTLRLIDKISSPLNSVGKSLEKNVRDWEKAGRSITKAGKNIAAVGGTMTKSLTAPIAAAGVACVKTASDFEAGMSTVQSISGATGKELDALSQKAKEMGAKTKFSATEATDAFKYMAMAGWKTEDMLNGIEGIMYLAGATGEDLASTSDIVTDALTAFGMSADDTERFVNVLAQTANNANTNVSMLGESFQYVAPVAGALKYNVEDVSTALGIMANSGVKASTAGTSLRSWMSRMSAPTDAVSSAMEKLGISLTDSDGNMKSFMTVMQDTRSAFSKLTEAEKAQYASTLAGKQGMSGLLAIVNASDSDFDSLTKAIYNSDGACKKMYDTANDNLQGQLTILKSTVESIAISFGERLTPKVKDITSWLQKLAEKFNALSEPQKDMVIKIAMIVAAVGPATLMFGKMVGTVGKVASTVAKVGRAFKVFGSIAGIVTSPVGIVIGVLGALVVAGILVYKNWDKIKKSAKKVFSYVKSVFESVGITGQSMMDKISPIKDKFFEIKDKAVELWHVVSPLVEEIGKVVTDIFKVKIGVAIGAAIGWIKTLVNSAIEWFGGFQKALGGVIDFITGIFSGNWSKAWSGIKDIFGGIFESIVALAKVPINGVISIINGAIAGINKLGITIPDWVPKIGGQKFSINIPTIPTLAKGTDNWKGGIVQISERGGEIVDLPRGSRVYPHDETVKKAYQDGARQGKGSVVINKLADKIIVREDADIDKIVDKLADKLEKVSKNLGGGDIEYSY